MLVSKLDRIVRDRLHPTVGRARLRMHTVAAGAALAAIAGLSAPVAAQAMAPASHQAPAGVPTSAVAAVTQQPAAPTHPAQPAANGQGGKSTPPAPKANKPSAPSDGQLHPTGVPGGQQTYTPSAEQVANAHAIVAAGKKMGLPPRAYVVAVATALQESNLHNLGNLGSSNDHDSLGLFQQRPSSGWGSPSQLQDPTYASTAFYKALTQVSGWSGMPVTDAAQAVQVSAFPDNYAKWEKLAGDLVQGDYGVGPYAHAFGH
jgi:hypothetical protein